MSKEREIDAAYMQGCTDVVANLQNVDFAKASSDERQRIWKLCADIQQAIETAEDRTGQPIKNVEDWEL